MFLTSSIPFLKTYLDTNIARRDFCLNLKNWNNCLLGSGGVAVDQPNTQGCAMVTMLKPNYRGFFPFTVLLQASKSPVLDL